MGSLRNFRSGKFHAYGQHTVKPENLRQAPFNVSDTSLDENAALLGLGLDVNFTNNAVLGVAYTGEIASSGYNYS